MHPVLFQLPLFGPVNAYGTLILIGGLVAMPCAYWDIGKRELAPGRRGSMLVDLYLMLVFGAVVGGRLAHVLTAPQRYLDDPAAMFAADGTGFVFFGSLGGVALGTVWLARRYDTDFTSVLDTGATWMPLMHVFGRLGCWSAGCCWGSPSAAAWAVTFGPQSVAYQAGEVAHGTDGLSTVSLHPTQLYESAGLLLCFAVLLYFRLTRGIEAPWRQASRYAVCYGTLRTLTEVFRGDGSRGYVLQWPIAPLSDVLALPAEHPVLLSISQAVGVALVVVGLWGLRRTRT